MSGSLKAYFNARCASVQVKGAFVAVLATFAFALVLGFSCLPNAAYAADSSAAASADSAGSASSDAAATESSSVSSDAAAADNSANDSASTSETDSSGSASSQPTGGERPENVVDPTQRADNSFIYDTTIASLFEQASLYDGRTVQVEGEVIGDLIYEDQRAGRCWITLTAIENDDSSSISVLISAEQAKQIDHYGRYGVKGTMLQVRGEYHQACDEHEGLPDLHATNSAVVARGIESPDHFEIGEFLPGLATVVCGLVLMGVFYFLRERMR